MQLKSILEGALLAAGKPLTLEQLGGLFEEGSRPEPAELQAALEELRSDCTGRGVELGEVATGFRLQVRRELAPWISRLSEDKPPRYSRALLETLAIIAYRQPITRADIEEVRGVAVNPAIIRTLQEREWVRVVGHRDVPGRPELLATTRQFLDHFSLKSLEALPALSEIKDFEQLNPEVPLAIEDPAAEPPEMPAAQAELGLVDAVPESQEPEAPSREDPEAVFAAESDESPEAPDMDVDDFDVDDDSGRSPG